MKKEKNNNDVVEYKGLEVCVNWIEPGGCFEFSLDKKGYEEWEAFSFYQPMTIDELFYMKNEIDQALKRLINK